MYQNWKGKTDKIFMWPGGIEEELVMSVCFSEIVPIFWASLCLCPISYVPASSPSSWFLRSLSLIWEEFYAFSLPILLLTLKWHLPALLNWILSSFPDQWVLPPFPWPLQTSMWWLAPFWDGFTWGWFHTLSYPPFFSRLLPSSHAQGALGDSFLRTDITEK